MLKAGGDHVPVGRQGERHSRAGQEVAGQAVDSHRHRIDRLDQSIRGQVGQADAQSVSPRLDGQVEHGQPGDHRTGEIGHRFHPLPADHVGVQPGPAVILPELSHDQHVDLVKRQSSHQLARLVEQPGLDLEQLLGLDGDDPRGVFESVLEDRDSQRDRGPIKEKGSDFGEHRLQPGQPELVDLSRSLTLAQPDGQHLEQATFVRPRE